MYDEQNPAIYNSFHILHYPTQPSGEQVICFIWLLSFAVKHEDDNTKFKSKFQEMSEFDSCAQNTMLTQGIQKVSVKDADPGHT